MSSRTMQTPFRRSLKPGLYGPLPTFFDDQQELHFDSIGKHLLNLATKGIVPVCAGSLGEAVHLTCEERVELIRFIRRTLDDADLNGTPLVAGVGGSSTRETLRLARDAAGAGADAGMVILPAYYAASLAANAEQIVQYYVDICEASPIPIMLYNFPANAAGLDMSAETIEAIVRRAPNLCGVKLTCPGNKEKLRRLVDITRNEPEINGARPFPLLLLDGLIEDFTPWMRDGGHGTVSGIPNFAPAAGVKLWTLFNKPDLTAEEANEADRIQRIMAEADIAAVPAGVRGMKFALNVIHGYSVAPRRPLLPLNEAEGASLMSKLAGLLALEAELCQPS